MHNYNFKNLNDKEFEVLVGDLLSEELGYTFQSFKSGKDKGIDLRYSTDINNKIVVQVKHYAKSSFAQLKFQLKNKELEKVKRLAPERYIIATSLELNPSEVDEIKTILYPFIKSTNDIYWSQRINHLISKFEKIEKNHFKLWLSSSSVLNNLLYNSPYLKSSYLEEEIKTKSSLYVRTNFHLSAYKILTSKKVLLIAGAPGVGKTTLAQMLVFDFIKQGYQHIVIEDKISEAENLLSRNQETKQIIYFDDFLGSNIYEILNPRNSENTLTRFISRIQNLPNKYLILTTRTTILNQALSSYEKIRYKNLHINSIIKIHINGYSPLQKAKILYNHIYFGDLDKKYKHQIFKNRNYFKIIQHNNYNPRLVEFFTSSIHTNNINVSAYINYVIYTLDNPKEIWKNSFEQQLTDDARFLLFSLFSLRGESSLNRLEKAYNMRIKNEINNYGYTLSNNSFNKALKDLEGSYIKVITITQNKTSVSFINPSISDFLFNYIKESKSEKKRLFQGIVFLEQITNIYHPSLKSYINFNEGEEIDFYVLLIQKSEEICQNCLDSSCSVKLLKVLLVFFPKYYKKKDFIKLFKNISPKDINLENYTDYIYILMRADLLAETKEIVLSSWNQYIYNLYKYAINREDFDRIHYLFEDYGKCYQGFIENKNNYNFIKGEFIRFLSKRIAETVNNNKYDYEYTEEHSQNQDKFRRLIRISLAENIEDIIYNELMKYEKMTFLAYGPYVTIDELEINIDNLLVDLEDSMFEYITGSNNHNSYIHYSPESETSNSDSSLIDYLFN